MGRNKSIDRSATLDAAERIVREFGALELTHGNLATVAGISKGGLRSSFGSKEGLMNALMDRWIADVTRRTVRGSESADVLESFVLSRLNPDQRSVDRIPALLATLSRDVQSYKAIRDCHAEISASLDDDAVSTPNLRLAYFAAQGFFLLQALSMMDVRKETADALTQDILDLLDAPRP